MIDAKSKIEDVQNEILVFLNKRMEGAKIRAKVYDLAFEEKPNQFFLQKAKDRATKNTISVLTVNNVKINTTDGIVNACRDFYSNLYRLLQNLLIHH